MYLCIYHGKDVGAFWEKGSKKRKREGKESALFEEKPGVSEALQASEVLQDGIPVGTSRCMN